MIPGAPFVPSSQDNLGGYYSKSRLEDAWLSASFLQTDRKMKLVGIEDYSQGVEDLGSQVGKDASRRTSNRMKHRGKNNFM